VLAGRRYELRRAGRLRLGVLRRQLDDADVVAAVRVRVIEAIERLGAAGLQIRDVDLPELDLVDDSLGAIILREAWEVHRDLFGRDADGYGPGTRALLELGSKVDEESYRTGLADRDRVAAAFAALFEEVDVLAGPTVAYAAPAEDPPVGTPEGDLEGRFTGPYNLAGNPAVSLPCGAAEGDLPAGLQLAAAVGADELLLSVARLYEEVSA
jgi:aspartyl-tRNA(Asn)/glutamyl-tRNA(Gln) amidotransferase subunit A